MLKLARQERLLSRADPNHSNRQPYSCCPCDVLSPLPITTCECGGRPFPFPEDHNGYASTDDQGGCECSRLTRQLALKQSDSPLISTYCCIGMDVCPKGRHYLHCQSVAVDHICQVVGGCASSASLVTSQLYHRSPSLATSVCCSSPCQTQTRKRIKRESALDDSQYPTLKREPSPSPPLLSPVPSDIRMKSHEKPPCLLKDHVSACCREEHPDSTTDECPVWAAHIPNGTSLQDVMIRFSEKLDTIRPLEKDQPHVSDKQPAPSVPSSQKPHFHADTHLTEIITTVLHTGSASDYNLSELFNRQDNKEAVTPNTRSRRRQEVLAAIAKPPSDASTRRKTLNIKRELAQYYDRKLPSKCTGEPKEEPKRSKAEETERKSTNESDVRSSGIRTRQQEMNVDEESAGRKAPDLCEGGFDKVQAAQMNSRRSRRTIVPPQRFSSYVTEPRKMFFVACFSENIFNPRAQEDEAFTPPSLDKGADPVVSGSQNVSHCSQVCSKSNSPGTPPGKRKLPPETDGGDSSVRKLRTSPRRQKILKTESSDVDENFPTSPVRYTSPIKLMLVSPVKVKDGVRYSLKTAPSGFDAHPQEPFDPCVESSWSGTPEKTTNAGSHHSTKCRSPAKSSPTKSPSTPLRSGSSPAKQSPKSVSPKTSSGRSTDFSPADRLCESQASPEKSFHDSAPKRRRGRPKKLRPQLETKIKRPIGRPRKQKASESETGSKTVDKNNLQADDPLNKNLKITVVYGRSRRNKRTVSESFDPLQMEFKDATQNRLKPATESSEDDGEQHKVPSTQSVKRPQQRDARPARKPGRPAKVKISGISVTVATVSPKQRKIKMKKESRESPEAAHQKRPAAFRCTTRRSRRALHQEAKQEEKKDKQKSRAAPVRCSKRIRKPSVYFLHAVATSSARSYSHSNALLRRSKQLLLHKASSEMKQEEQRSCGGEKLQGRRKSTSQDFHKMAEVSVDSIFTRRDPLQWWASSTEEAGLKQELVQQIHLISGSWVSARSPSEADGNGLVKTLFTCPPDKPWSCSAQQLRSWFMQTTETRSLNIVKQASARNPYEVMHFPRPVSKRTSCSSSPQAERLRKHVKKFAKTVPQSPAQHRAAQRKLRIERQKHNVRRKLFSYNLQGAKREIRAGTYPAVLSRAKTKFRTRKEREVWLKRQGNKKEAGRLKRRGGRSQTREPADAHKEPKYCTNQAWSPETLKDCCVFLKKINPAHHRTPERRDWTLDERSAEHRQRKRSGVVEAVKRKRRMTTRSSPRSGLEHDNGQTCKSRSTKVVSPDPPRAKTMRQSRMRGLTGPRWCDFVFES